MLALHQRLIKHSKQGLSRQRRMVESRSEARIAWDGKEYIDFSSNDYLGHAHSPVLRKSYNEAMESFGVGSGSSAVVSGYTPVQQRLELLFAQRLKRDAAVFFNSGYHANTGLFSALTTRDSVVISDRLCHASLLDGIQLSRARHKRFPHNDMAHLATIVPDAGDIWLCSESIFSMQGTLSKISQLVSLCKEENINLVMDDAHGFGVLGPNGWGVAELASQDEVPCVVIPLGKAMGCMGAIVVGTRVIIDALLQFCRSYYYTTAAPAAMAAAAFKSCLLLNEQPWRRQRLLENIEHFNVLADRYQIKTLSDRRSPIQSVLVGCEKTLMRLHATLMQKGFFTAAIRSPSVPAGTERIRISLNAFHKCDDIERLLADIASCLRQCNNSSKTMCND
jgi:8-amino-7-oxononanoate synthase